MIPDWIEPELWAAYLEMRKKIKRPMTDYAQRLAFRKLEGFRQKGHDVTAIIEESIMQSWQGLFEPRQKPMQTNGASEAWQLLRQHIRSNTEPPEPIKRACAAIGGFWRLTELESRTLDFKQREFEAAYRDAAH